MGNSLSYYLPVNLQILYDDSEKHCELLGDLEFLVEDSELVNANSNLSPEPSKKKRTLFRTFSSGNETEFSQSPSSPFPSLDSISEPQERNIHEENSFEAPPLSPNEVVPPFEDNFPLPLLKKVKEEPRSPEQKFVPELGYVREK